MKFGYTPLSDDFSPRPLSLYKSKPEMRARQTQGPKHLYTGLSSFSHPEWIGSIYPKSTARKGMLSAYASLFSAIEFNATRYKFPSPEQIDRWSSQTQSTFRFYPKVPQSISHSKNYLDRKTSDRLADFMDLSKGFKAKLGLCFLCFPNHVSAKRLDEILEWIGTMETGLPLAFELRHPSWFGPNSNAIYMLSEALTAKNLPLIITDTPGRQDVRHDVITSAHVMVRFVASGNPTVDQQRISLWQEAFVTHEDISTMACFVHAPTENKTHLLTLMDLLKDNPHTSLTL